MANELLQRLAAVEKMDYSEDMEYTLIKELFEHMTPTFLERCLIIAHLNGKKQLHKDIMEHHEVAMNGANSLQHLYTTVL